jgi:enamine deaminase RidA (YjgF/YER057c/UK114 family)
MTITGGAGIVRHRFADVLSEPISHYTDAVVAGGFLFISGMIATDASGQLIGAGDIVAQTEQVFKNIELVLGRLGASLDDVVKVVVYLTDRSGATFWPLTPDEHPHTSCRPCAPRGSRRN